MIKWDDGSNREILSDMWQRIFHDTRPYIGYYFDEIYQKNEVLLEENEDKIRGMLHLNPYTMQIRNEDVPLHYIVGVSTEEEYRRQGVMRQLLLETFRSLRQRGEAFTYLMPADENYYLPFSFRFGMDQLEQEIVPAIAEIVDKAYEFYRFTDINASDFVSLENDYKRNTYAVSSKIDTDYLKRVDQEVRSEFGCYFYVKKENKPIGHFVVYAEDDFMSVSQLVCYDSNLRSEFLRQLIQFCDGRYHFRSYKITYPEDWDMDLIKAGQYGQTHILKTARNRVIMFRILCLEKLERWLCADSSVSCILKVTDPDLSDQQGYYSFTGDENGMKIIRLGEDEMTKLEKDDVPRKANGYVTIAHLTERLFGHMMPSDENTPKNFDHAAMEFWKSVRPLTPIDIPEIV